MPLWIRTVQETANVAAEEPPNPPYCRQGTQAPNGGTARFFAGAGMGFHLEFRQIGRIVVLNALI